MKLTEFITWTSNNGERDEIWKVEDQLHIDMADRPKTPQRMLSPLIYLFLELKFWKYFKREQDKGKWKRERLRFPVS
jgi:hypothetical protein